jgi:small conductance mechanosensitive channel
MNNFLSDSKLLFISYNILTVYSIIKSCIILFITWYTNSLLHAAIKNIALRTHLNSSLSSLFVHATSVGIYTIGSFLALETFGIQASSLLRFVGLLSVGIGLALQKIMSNIAAGVFILLYKPFAVGDTIHCNHAHFSFQGTITSIDLRTTTLIHQNNIILVPNQILYENVIAVSQRS